VTNITETYRRNQVQPKATSSRGNQKDKLMAAKIEVVNQALALMNRSAAVQATTTGKKIQKAKNT
jgi:hypothetical protein